MVGSGELISMHAFLRDFNKEQQKAIKSNSDKILCVAGAGSGKTTVLTKRIEYLIRYKNVDPKSILAITFTRKAKGEMLHRLKQNNVSGINCHTFNSFCEGVIQKHHRLIYKNLPSIIQTNEIIKLVKESLKLLGIPIHQAVNYYFTAGQQKRRSPEELFVTFALDAFFIYEKQKEGKCSIDKTLSSSTISAKESLTLKLLKALTSIIESKAKAHIFRSYDDQINDVLKLFTKFKISANNLVPKYTHILVDEYQDINSEQEKIIDILNSENLFFVGDPRQAIYGWRGSSIKFIHEKSGDKSNWQKIALYTNYRSTNGILTLANNSIRNMEYEDLICALHNKDPKVENEIEQFSFESEEDEMHYILRCLQSNLEKGAGLENSFVLARTNKQLRKLSDLLNKFGIKHVLKTEYNEKHQKENHTTLATVHAAKGLEAEEIFVMGIGAKYFPCKASEHPIIDLLSPYQYNKYEEEQRLLYVAITRAKQKLHLTYTGEKKTPFLTDDIVYSVLDKNKKLVEKLIPISQIVRDKHRSEKMLYERLKSWREQRAQELDLPNYFVVTNKALKELSRKAPLTAMELKKIGSIHPYKKDQFGDEIIKVIQSC